MGYPAYGSVSGQDVGLSNAKSFVSFANAPVIKYKKSLI
jgi:hypothetical protein